LIAKGVVLIKLLPAKVCHRLKMTVRLELLLPFEGFELIEEVFSRSKSFMKNVVLAVTISRLN